MQPTLGHQSRQNLLLFTIAFILLFIVDTAVSLKGQAHA